MNTGPGRFFLQKTVLEIGRNEQRNGSRAQDRPRNANETYLKIEEMTDLGDADDVIEEQGEGIEESRSRPLPPPGGAQMGAGFCGRQTGAEGTLVAVRWLRIWFPLLVCTTATSSWVGA